jgi:hypothetical protein
MATSFFRLGGLVPDYECADLDNKFYINSNQVRKNQAAACEMVRSCKNLTAHNAWVSIFQEFEVSFLSAIFRLNLLLSANNRNNFLTCQTLSLSWLITYTTFSGFAYLTILRPVSRQCCQYSTCLRTL